MGRWGVSYDISESARERGCGSVEWERGVGHTSVQLRLVRSQCQLHFTANIFAFLGIAQINSMWLHCNGFCFENQLHLAPPTKYPRFNSKHIDLIYYAANQLDSGCGQVESA